jgi:hypothetical protein
MPADGLARLRISNDPESVRCTATSRTRPGKLFPRITINAAVIARYDAVSVVVQRATSTGGIRDYDPCRQRKFVDISEQIGADFKRPRAHRGAIAVDLNNDGRLDIVSTSLGDRPEIWEKATAGGRWLQVRLIGSVDNRDGIGARVQAGKQVLKDVATNQVLG